jgi:N-acetyl sugar amidotransferase
MDTSVDDICFDENGICNYCSGFLETAKPVLAIESAEKSKKLNELLEVLKKAGKGKKYDCVVGVSGGVDSSWALVQTVKAGLRPLAVHMDNGWNTELAQNNIANLVGKLGVDLYTHVIDWEEYRSLMQAFFDSDVIDVELLYDNAMFAVNYRQAYKYGVKYILSGMNTTSEGMEVPKTWNWHKFDKKNIVDICKMFGDVKLKTFPAIGTLDLIYFKHIKQIQWVPFPDYFDYNKLDAMKILQAEYDYKPYPYKHYESVFTRFYQGFILLRKFNVDKRRVHLGTLVASGQMSREDAMGDLQRIPYPSEADLEADKRYFLKKMGWTNSQLEEYVTRPGKPHMFYASEKPMWDWILTSRDDRTLYNAIKKLYKLIRGLKHWIVKHHDFARFKPNL